MSYPPAKRIAIFGNSYQEQYLSGLELLLRRLVSSGAEISVERRFAAYLRSRGLNLQGMAETDSMPRDTDMLMSFGGDGTFLRAADWADGRELPIMGVNTGHLGYLAGFRPENREAIMAALDGCYELTPRMVIGLSCRWIPTEFRPYALNEIAISKGDTTSMVTIKAWIDGRFLTEYLSDGLLISTPTGSTAYNLSCGGPILQPTMQSLVLTPIAPHSLTMRPVVVDSASRLRLEVSSRGERCHIGVDGRTFAVPADGTRLEITKAPFCVNVTQPTGSDFASLLRNKLGWGGGATFCEPTMSCE